jgi:hypothetical protein
MPLKENFLEVRLYVSDREQKPEDLTLVTGSLLLTPQSGPPLKKDFQLMMPAPPEGVPTVEAHSLPDGHQLRVAIASFDTAFQVSRPAGSPPSVYFKADIPAEKALKDSTATICLQFPSGKQLLELQSLFGK